MRRLWVAIAAIAIATTMGTGVITTAAASTVAVPAETTGGLSESGQAAIADLRTCLASKDVLNVYYLIDASGSLNPDIMRDEASDPEGLRAPILANSLKQLGAVDDTTVWWNAGFFNGRFIDSSEVGWNEYTPGDEEQLDDAIRDREARGDTNWPEALSNAQMSLAAQQATQPGCQLLVWLTDGQLDLREGDSDRQEIRDALNAMCGSKLDEGGADPAGNGIFNSLRQSGVVVVGALLATNERAAGAGQVMRPLVEGSVHGEAPTCGEHPIPDGYAHGAFVEADSADALSQVFLQLGAQVGGGAPCGFDDVGFWVDPGVARFRIVLSGAWTLTPPVESGLAPSSTEGSQPWIPDIDNNPSTIDVVTTDPIMQGKWHLDAGETKSRFCFSDLKIELDPANEIVLAPDGTAGEPLRARVQSLSGGVADLNLFGTADVAAYSIGPDGKSVPIGGVDVNPATGEITFSAPAVTAAEVVVEVRIDPLRTTPHELLLWPVIARQSVPVTPPSDFPRVKPVPVDLGLLDGSNGVASGDLIVVGPESGASGSVCIGGDPEIDSDSTNREDSWQWDITGLDDAGCIDVEDSEETLTITVSNSEAANSAVRASLPIELRSASGQSVPYDVPIVFTTTHRVSAPLVLLIALALLLLGILLPLLALWLLNWRTTRLDIDNGIQRASFRVRIGPGGVAFAEVPASDSALAERFQYRPPQRNVRSVDDPDLGRLAAHVPWFPLAEPTYRITPRAGTSIIGARTSARAASAGVRRDDGSMEFRQLPLDAFWAILVSHADLARTGRGDEVAGTAVLYHRMDPSQQDQYRARLSDIGLEGSLTDAVDRTRAGLAEAQAKQNAKKSSKGGDAPSTAAAPTPGAPGRDGAPPPRGGATPPPRGADAPPRDGAPPPRGGTTPPPRPGSPPPRGR